MFLDVEFDSTASSEALGGVQRVLFCWEELARVRAEVVVAENSHEPLALRVEQRGVSDGLIKTVGAVVSSTFGSTALIESPNYFCVYL